VPEGYPNSPVKNEQINVSKIENPDGLFYASVDIQNGKLVEAGSRTVAVVGVADSISNAENIAEKEVSAIAGPLFHRSDIGTDMVIQKRINHMKSIR
jgi:Phosphoribosylamine-glycine ligase